MRWPRISFAILRCVVLFCLLFRVFGVAELLAAPSGELSERLDAVVQEAVDDGTIPGAVVLVGRGDAIPHRKAYGLRSIEPTRQPMQLDTIFDCASLTKVVVTAPAVMMLVEEGKVRLADRVTKHLPDFSGGESPIRLLDLLTHFSGLRPDVDLEPVWSGYETGINKAYEEVPVALPGSQFIYSDINYLLLAEVVRKTTGKRIDEFAAERIFGPLGMTDTRFLPPRKLLARIAPTERLPGGSLLHGVVHDPTTRFMGGVAGHAGMFSTADDLSRFAQMMLRGGQLGDARILSPLAVVKMTTPQSPRNHPALRGLGWDIDSPYSSTRGDLFAAGSYGHTGYTGTSMWMDPGTRTYVILMTNRVHPTVGTSVVDLRAKVASIVAASLSGVDAEQARRASWQRSRSTVSAPRTSGGREATVLSGLDILVREKFARFSGKRVGLITNHSGIDRRRRRNIDLFFEAPGVTLAAIFSPEHGIAGRQDHEQIEGGKDEKTGVAVHSLYQGDQRRLTAAMLSGIDVLVFDIQDAGARFYTYTTTMAYAMEEAAQAGIPFCVLDRPNPITGIVVEGPMLDEAYRSFVGYFPMPVRHGMTAGELAGMFNQERKIGAQLQVVQMEGWSRGLWFDETKLPWVDPSPNIRGVEQALLYPGIALLEGLPNYSVGRGTDTPFLFVGADWIDGAELADDLNSAGLRGIRFYPVRRTPKSSRFAGRPIEGVQITVLDRGSVRSTRIGLEVATQLLESYPGRVDVGLTAKLIGHQATIEALSEGRTSSSIWSLWQAQQRPFLRIRTRYLLY
jgi:uncharacterized protein YbbC (DUF1343 family)